MPRYALSVEDARGGAEQVALDRMRAAMSHQVLDVSRWPLFDIRAVRYSGGRVRLGFSLDLLMLDALSIVIVFAELSELYHRPGTRLPEIGVSFRDYVLGACGDREQLAESKRYWAERAPSLPPAPQLPLRTDPELVAQPRFTRRQSRIPRQRWQRIVERARQRGLTPASVLATCFAEVLGRWSRQRELTLNLTLFDRREVHPEINGVVGDFTALLLVGYEPRAGECFAERAARFQRQMWQDLDHRDVSAVQVMRDLAASRGSAAAMPVVFTSALGIGRDVAAERFAEEVWGLSQTPQVWLDHQVRDDEGGMRFNWDAVEELFPEGLLDAMFQAECRLLDWLADADWSQQLPDLLPTSQRAVREQENSTREPTAAATLLHSGFFARADADPARTALVWGADQRCEYGELADLALRVAAHLVERGVRAGDNVAVALPKGRDQIVAVLGVLAAGAVYVPVGVDQPDQRRQRIYSRAGVRVVLDDLAEAYRRKPLAGPVEVDPESLAYVIFTSGSTGEPKGVMVSHASAMNTIADVNARFGVGAEDRVLAISALDFDLSVYDIFGLLSVGGSVVLIDEDGRREAREWAGLCRRWNVTVWNTVPALLDMLLVVADVLPGSFRLALVSGDWVGLDLWDRLRERAPGCALVALGGATEAAIWSNFFEVERVDPRWRSIPYGRPLANQRFRVVDPTGQDCPEWTEGELWIGGRGVAAGYCGDADRTAERFVEWDGIRWYRTGDLGRYWPDGVLEFLGRVDNQVKVRGHRIELGEIEAALTAHPDVGQAVAASVGDRAPALVAVVVPEGDRSCDSDELRSWLLDRLPAYMVPERIAEIAEVPLTANGKLDRASAIRGLADGAREPAETGEPLRGEVEIALAEQWREVLGVPALARDDNFFVLGGDSLLATRVVERIRRLFGVDIALREFLAGPSLQQQGELVKQRSQAGHQMEEGVI
ncbi:amino acid adenylation domain-containing protein [Saccharopolyspora spinosa]|uniref:non-ribosomal peptide synthetase n=1 Tax=Saccharopolyspora spinosa TaxID=60894 RepID=UPI00376F41AA